MYIIGSVGGLGTVVHVVVCIGVAIGKTRVIYSVFATSLET